MNAQLDVIRLVGANVRLELLPLGATLRGFWVRGPEGDWRNIVVSPLGMSTYRGANCYLGSTIGRVANRVEGARFTLDGVERRLDANEAPNNLHGGGDGWSFRTWGVTGQGSDWVEFALTSPDGDQGFPGQVRVSARYQLLPEGALVAYHATTDASTVVNITTHPFFNLNGEGAGTIEDHSLAIHAPKFTPTRADGIPTGEIRSVNGSGLDFRGGRGLGEALGAVAAEGLARNHGLDHNFVVEGTGMREHCRLTSADGLELTLMSDQPSLQVYSGEHFDGTHPGMSGRPLIRRGGIALEAQGFPDAPNHPNFPSVVLRPGEEYRHTTSWRLRLSGQGTSVR